MSDMDPTSAAADADGGKDKTSPEEKRVLNTVAKALFRSSQAAQTAPLSREERASLSPEEKEKRKEAMDQVWKDQRKVYLKEAKKLMRQLNLSAENVVPRPKKRKGAAAEGTADAE